MTAPPDTRIERAESAVLERSKARESNRLPRIGDDGIPHCSYEACAQYDGKRCRELGFRPGSLCEPQIADMARELAAYRAHYVTKTSADLALRAAVASKGDSMKAQNWAVSARYAAPGGRPGNRRHPSPDDFRRRTIVGPAAGVTVETVLDLLEVPEDVRVKIRANSVVQNFVEGKLVPDQPYPHHFTGGHYVNENKPDEQFVEWSIEFAFVTRRFDAGMGGVA